MNAAFYQYRFFLQISHDVTLACTKITSQDDCVIIERNHVFGQKTLNDMVPESSLPGSGIWFFTKKSNAPDLDIGGRFVAFSWTAKQWLPFKLWHSSSEFAMETIKLNGVVYIGSADVAPDKIPRRLIEAFSK